MSTIAPTFPDRIRVPSLEAPAGAPFSWLRDMTATLREVLLVHGAVRLHGLPLAGPDSLAEARDCLGIGSFTPTEVFNRRADFGSGILSPISWPQDRHICPLQESSFSTTFPWVVLTACFALPDGDGRAHLSDARHIAEHLPAEPVDRVGSGGWTMTRNFHTGIGISWREAFSVPDWAAVEGPLRDR